ncbi:MAG: ParB/RepB/Spo0J family partition protein [bacterium]|nr:ParB/RepB/Spo0J family partition protein [bacterium]
MPDTFLDIPLDQIDAQKLTLRERLDERGLSALTASIQRYGVIEPIVVTPTEEGYNLVVGKRRLEACRRLGHATIPAIVRRVSEDRGRELSYQSNLQVNGLNMADEVDFLRRIDIFHLPDEEAAGRLAMTADEVAVARRFNRLPPPIREAVRTGEIDERRALALTRLAHETDQTRMFRYIRENDPPIEALENMVNRVRTGDAPYI